MHQRTNSAGHPVLKHGVQHEKVLCVLLGRLVDDSVQTEAHVDADVAVFQVDARVDAEVAGATGTQEQIMHLEKILGGILGQQIGDGMHEIVDGDFEAVAVVGRLVKVKAHVGADVAVFRVDARVDAVAGVTGTVVSGTERFSVALRRVRKESRGSKEVRQRTHSAGHPVLKHGTQLERVLVVLLGLRVDDGVQTDVDGVVEAVAGDGRLVRGAGLGEDALRLVVREVPIAEVPFCL